jgi:biopolymer transport protein ExbB/TolQ
MAQTIASVDARTAPDASQAPGVKTLFSKISDPFRSLLLLRFTLFNVMAIALLAVAYTQGYVERVIQADQTYLSVVIFVVFVVGLGLCTHRIWQTNSEIDALNSSDGIHSPKIAHLVAAISSDKAESRANLSGSMRLRIAHRISVVRHLANTLVLLGLIGTVLGFIIALSGVDPQKAADVESIAPMVSTLIQGMSTALYTTLIGSILNVWLMANYQLLTGGTVQLISSLQERVERDA